MSARHDARAGETAFRDPKTTRPFAIGSKVRCAAGNGIIEFVAFSSGMSMHIYTVAMDTRTKLRLCSRDIELIEEATP